MWYLCKSIIRRLEHEPAIDAIYKRYFRRPY
jgi:hypothetical protein